MFSHYGNSVYWSTYLKNKSVSIESKEYYPVTSKRLPTECFSPVTTKKREICETTWLHSEELTNHRVRIQTQATKRGSKICCIISLFRKECILFVWIWLNGSFFFFKPLSSSVKEEKNIQTFCDLFTWLRAVTR